MTVANSFSFKYKSNFLGKPTNIVTNNNNVEVLDGANPIWKNAQIIVPLKYISYFFRSLELPTLDAANSATFKIATTELYVPLVTLNTEDNNKLNKVNWMILQKIKIRNLKGLSIGMNIKVK